MPVMAKLLLQLEQESRERANMWQIKCVILETKASDLTNVDQHGDAEISFQTPCEALTAVGVAYCSTVDELVEDHGQGVQGPVAPVEAPGAHDVQAGSVVGGRVRRFRAEGGEDLGHAGGCSRISIHLCLQKAESFHRHGEGGHAEHQAPVQVEGSVLREHHLWISGAGGGEHKTGGRTGSSDPELLARENNDVRARCRGRVFVC